MVGIFKYSIVSLCPLVTLTMCTEERICQCVDSVVLEPVYLEAQSEVSSSVRYQKSGYVYTKTEWEG